MENTMTRTTERETNPSGRCNARQHFAGSAHPFRCVGGFAHSFDHAFIPDDDNTPRITAEQAKQYA